MRKVICFIMLVACVREMRAQVDRLELGYQTTRRGVVWYRDGLPTWQPVWKLSKDTNAVLWVNKTTGIRYDWDYSASVWRAHGIYTTTLPPLPTQSSGSATLDNRTAFWKASDSLTLRFEYSQNAWVPIGGLIYRYAAPANISAGSGNGAAVFTTSLWQDSDDKTVYYWDGSAWTPFGSGGAGSGTVTSVAATAPAAGFTISGSPITSSGDLIFSLSDDLAGVEAVSDTGIVVRSASNTWITRALQAGTGISIAHTKGTTHNPIITNTAPDQTVSITGAGINAVTGTYPNFTITGTEVDGSTTNELQTYSHAGTTSYTNTLSNGGGSFSINAGTGIGVAHSGGAVTISSTLTGLPSGTTNQTLRHNGSAWVATSGMLNDGTQIAINGSILSGFNLYVNGAQRNDGSLVLRGTGSYTAATTSPHVRLWNTTATTGDTYYLASTDAGEFHIESNNGGANRLNITTAGQVQTVAGFRIGSVSGTPTTIIGRNASGDIGTVGVGTGLSLSGGTLSATATGTISGTLTSPRIPYASGASTLADDAQFTWDNTNKRVIIGTGTSVASLNIFPTATSGTLEGVRVSGNTSGNVFESLLNANNASTSANSIKQISTGGASAGDPAIQFSISGAITNTIGTDNSDGDKFKITPNASLPGANTNASFVATNSNPPQYGINTDAPATGSTLDVAGKVRGQQFYNPSSPSCTGVVGTGAGTGATIPLLDGGANWLRLTISTGTAPVNNGVICTITLPYSFASLPVITLHATDNTSSDNFVKIRIGSLTSNTFQLVANGTLPASTSLNYHLHVGGF